MIGKVAHHNPQISFIVPVAAFLPLSMLLVAETMTRDWSYQHTHLRCMRLRVCVTLGDYFYWLTKIATDDNTNVPANDMLIQTENYPKSLPIISDCSCWALTRASVPVPGDSKYGLTLHMLDIDAFETLPQLVQFQALQTRTL